MEFYLILTKLYGDLDVSNLLAKYEAPSGLCFREVKNVKIWFLSHNLRLIIGGATST